LPDGATDRLTMSIAVIMPNFNNGPYLWQCLDSFADDEAIGEIVIYDNASSDDSCAVIEAHPSPKIRLIRGATNLYATGGRHEAIRSTSLPYLSFVDGDDFVSQKLHSICLNQLQQHSLDAAVPNTLRVDGDGRNPRMFVPAPTTIINGEDGLMMTIGHWRLSLWGVFRREVYERAWEGFAPYGYRDDELLLRRMILACNRIGGAPADQFYRTIERPPPPLPLQVHSAQTQMRAVALAASRKRKDWEETLRLTRNETVWSMLRLLRALPRDKARSTLPKLLRDFATIDLPWKPHDWPHWAASHGLMLASMVDRLHGCRGFSPCSS
jgi:glycosyltransferase involved in cell wall biosynthesis